MVHAETYRSHDPGNDYYDRGIYHITLVVSGRESLLSSLNMDEHNPGVQLTSLGEAVKSCWEMIPTHHAQKGRKLKLHACVCMPDHFHGVIEVVERMDVSVGEVICGFKAGCTKAWRKLNGLDAHQPNTADERGCDAKQPYMAGGAAKQPYMVAEGMPDLHRMSRRQRREYYDQLAAAGLRVATPLFDDNYDDTICLRLADGSYDGRHLAAMVGYVNDNPRRAIMRRLHPDFMRRCLHLRLGTGRVGADGAPEYRDYAAFGNLFLLRWARKVQVFCHRKARYGMLTVEEKQQWGYMRATPAGSVTSSTTSANNGNITGATPAGSGVSMATYAADYITSVPYEKTLAFRSECREWKRMVMEGATVMVTPGISMGERFIKDRCIESGYPLIHIQGEAIGRYWKPEAKHFKACERGSMLILAPWKPDTMGDVNGVPSDTSYSIFHNLNGVAEEICKWP